MYVRGPLIPSAARRAVKEKFASKWVVNKKEKASAAGSGTSAPADEMCAGRSGGGGGGGLKKRRRIIHDCCERRRWRRRADYQTVTPAFWVVGPGSYWWPPCSKTQRSYHCGEQRERTQATQSSRWPWVSFAHQNAKEQSRKLEKIIVNQYFFKLVVVCSLNSFGGGRVQWKELRRLSLHRRSDFSGFLGEWWTRWWGRYV